MAGLLDDEPRRLRMSHAAAARASRHDLSRTFDAFWDDHLRVVEPPQPESGVLPSLPHAQEENRAGL
jgi:hypothetical protein